MTVCPDARSGTPRAPSRRHAAQRRPRQPVDGELDSGMALGLRGVGRLARLPVDDGAAVGVFEHRVDAATHHRAADDHVEGDLDVDGVRAAHGEAANAACSSARPSASSRASCRRPHRAGRRGRIAARRRRSAAPNREMRCPASSMRVGPRRQPAAQPSAPRRRRPGRASPVLTDSAAGVAGRCGSTRSRSASSASTSAPSRRDRRRPHRLLSRHRASDYGPTVHIAAARARRIGRPHRLDDLVPQRVRSPSAGVGAQCRSPRTDHPRQRNRR